MLRVFAAIAALCMFVSAYLILVIDRHHARIGDRRRASRRTVMGFRVVGIAGLVLLAWSMEAHARPSPYPATQFSGDRYVSRQAQGAGAADVVNAVRSKRRARYLYPTRKRPPVRRQQWRHDIAHGAGQRTSEVARVIGGRPAGCPTRFCGCGASIHLFGRIIPALNLAANWLRFPRAAPAPKMVAARRGHVFVLERHIAGNVWLVHDSNSGGRKTRLHPRSIAGFTIVNPRSS